MRQSYKMKVVVLALGIGLALPFPARAILDFGGWVINTPGTHYGEIFLTSFPSFPPSGVNIFWDSGGGPCVNGVQEVAKS